MNILVDTNILINLEDNKIIGSSFSSFYKLAISNNCKILYHPLAIQEDLRRDKNEERQKIILSKLKKYEVLENPAPIASDFLNIKSIQNQNDNCDNQQIYQLFKGYVELFVTEDKGIHKKAKLLGIETRTLDINKAVKFLEDNYRIIIPKHPILDHQGIRALENDFKSEFFDSLRNDYDSSIFDNWLNKCVKENRQCYFVKSENNLVAILIYNEEKAEGHQIPSIYEKALKICTLKVFDTLFGSKIGELFLQKMFEYCINQNINYLYLTVYEKHTQLILLLSRFGFKSEFFINKLGVQEMRMVKVLNKNLLSIKSNEMEHHPFYTDNFDIGKFVVPIQPAFYNLLFKDGQLRTPSLFDQFQDSINEIQGNSILKAYISASHQTNLKKGDVLLFYASKKNQVIEPIGVLESIQIVDNFTELWEIVRKKTVFSTEKLEEMLGLKGKLHVITFRLISYLNKPIRLREIKQIGSFRNKLQTITRIQESDYIKLKNDGHFDRRYIID